MDNGHTYFLVRTIIPNCSRNYQTAFEIDWTILSCLNNEKSYPLHPNPPYFEVFTLLFIAPLGMGRGSSPNSAGHFYHLLNLTSSKRIVISFEAFPFLLIRKLA